MIAIETRSLSRSFGKLIAVKDLNLKIPAGAIYGLIGPNGAGKTTTLRMLAGLLEPTRGEILVDGQQVNHDWRDLQRKIGYMPDFFGVYEDMLVWEYLDFFARCYGIDSQRRGQVVTELLELVDLANKRDSYVQTLSRGMRQRLCLAHTLVHDPQVLLLDEPASGLDPRARVEMRELLRELGSMGKTIVLSSHILIELAELCDSIGIIEKGDLVISGSLTEIRQHALQTRNLRLRILTNLDEAKSILQSQPGVNNITTVNGEFEVEFHGDEESAADLLHTLITRGVRLAAFQEVASDLEEIFLRLTKGEVS
ncbi:MAG: ABC transporter ATP-binding protein [Anaerolineales bacterium]|nr:ABC transporter ATP-binding protein [Anaerolineales bacterium]